MVFDFPWPERKKHRPALLAHRGGMPEVEFENTRQAFDAAIVLGADGLESDLHATRDGVLVMCHDPVLNTINGKIEIATSTWGQLSKVTLLNGEKPLTFPEFVERYPNIYLNLDMKKEAVVQPLMKYLDTLPQCELNRMAFGSFSENRLKVLRAKFGNSLAYLAGPGTLLRIIVAAEFGLTPAVLGDWKEQIGRLALAVPPIYGIKNLLTARILAFAHSCDMPVYVWTINEVAEFQRLSAIGVDGVYTDSLPEFAQLS